MLEILNGREHFFQWDTNQKLIIEDNEIVVVQYDNGTGDALVCPVYEYEGQRVADVPNIMLQMPIVIKAYAACEDCVRYARAYKVEQRSRPDDYIYTETETLKYTKLLSMLEEKEAALREDINTFTAEAAATDELLFEKMEAETQQLESEIESNAAAIETLNTSVNYIRNTELVNHNGRINYLQNTATSHDKRITKLEENGGTGGGSGCECGKRIIIKTDNYSNFESVEGMELEELFTLDLQQVKSIKWELKVSNASQYEWNQYKIDSATDVYINIYFTRNGVLADKKASILSAKVFTINKQEKVITIANYAEFVNYRMPTPTTDKQYLVAENGEYKLVDDVGGGDSSGSTEPPMLLIYDNNGEMTFEEGTDLGAVVESPLNSIVLVADITTGTKAALYRIAEMSMDETNPYYIYANGYGKAIKIDFLYGTANYME